MQAVSQGLTPRNNERIARDLRAIDRQIPSCKIASYLQVPHPASPGDEVEQWRRCLKVRREILSIVGEAPATTAG